MVILITRIVTEKIYGIQKPGLFSNAAKSQVGKGFRGAPVQDIVGINIPKTSNIDAAHRMNTTFILNDAIALNIPKELAYKLHTLSASTTYQFQTANLCADKVIDGCQT